MCNGGCHQGYQYCVESSPLFRSPRNQQRVHKKDFKAAGILPFITISNRLYYYTEVECVLAIAKSLRVGLNPGEVLDLVLGFTTLDIYGDDVRYSCYVPE